MCLSIKSAFIWKTYNILVQTLCTSVVCAEIILKCMCTQNIQAMSTGIHSTVGVKHV